MCKGFCTCQIDGGFEDVNKLNRGREILRYGCPDQGSGVRYYSNHVLMYDQQKKIPFWVAEHLSADLIKGTCMLCLFGDDYF